jgi:hypothetical protein
MERKGSQRTRKLVLINTLMFVASVMVSLAFVYFLMLDGPSTEIYPELNTSLAFYQIDWWLDAEGYTWVSYNNGTHQFYAPSASMAWEEGGFKWRIGEANP